MNSYKHIPIWENSQRTKDLCKFRDDVVLFFRNSEYLGVGIGRVENDQAREVRQRLNLTRVEVHRFIEAAGIAPIVTWTPPPNIGGYVKEIDVVLNLFELRQFQIPTTGLIDFIEMAIGVYLSDRKAAWRRTVNPLWWLWRGFLWSFQIPFFFLGSVGFNVTRAEERGWGKWVRLLTVVAEVLTILYLMGWLPAAKTLLGIK